MANKLTAWDIAVLFLAVLAAIFQVLHILKRSERKRKKKVKGNV